MLISLDKIAQGCGMADRRAPETTEDCNSPLAKTLGKGCETLLPVNDKGIVTDNEFLEHREKLVDRSKLIFWWRAISNVFNMVASALIPAGIALLTGGLIHGELTTPLISAIGVLFGVSAVSLTVGIA